MPYYLQHYFNPDFDHTAVRPLVDGKGQADRYNLGYVQNAIRGQVLAELMPLEAVPYPNERFILREAVLPAGPNTRIDPAHPRYLLADANGYVFYYNGLISVKNVLNVRRDVDFRTGNIVFAGDLAVHHDLKPGFQIQAANLLIKGMIEGGIARSCHSMVVEGGVRGGVANRCLAAAGGNLRAAFAEKAELRAGGKLFIERFCLHSTLYSGGPLVVGDRLVGGLCRASSLVFVQGDLGNRAGVSTRVALGRDPLTTRLRERCEQRLAEVEERLARYELLAGTATETDETARKTAAARNKLAVLRTRYDELQGDPAVEDVSAEKSRLIVKNNVYPGVEVTIGDVAMQVSETLSNVCFRLRNNEIAVEPAPERPES